MGKRTRILFDKCSVHKCSNPPRHLGLCATHYNKKWRSENIVKENQNRKRKQSVLDREREEAIAKRGHLEAFMGDKGDCML
jgi:hypothetical protein